MMMKKFFQKQREILVLLAFGAGLFCLARFVVMPILKKINDINNQVQEETLNQEVVKQRIAELPKIQKQYESLQSGSDLSGVLLSKDKAVVLIEKLEKLAEQTGNGITISVQDASIDAKKTTAKPRPGSEIPLTEELPSQDFLQMKIILTGKYASLVSFVAALENFEYYCDIVAIQVNKDEKNAVGKSSQATVGSGLINPFASVAGNSALKVQKNESDTLLSSLDTVFYVKKN